VDGEAECPVVTVEPTTGQMTTCQAFRAFDQVIPNLSFFFTSLLADGATYR
jgi:hypothetical protein